MTGYTMCPKYAMLSNVISNRPVETTDNMVFINFDCILNEILEQWSDIGYQSEHNASRVVNGVVQFVAEVISHFKQYFKDHTMILYHTDIDSHSQQFKTGMDDGSHYRENYLTKFDTIKFRDFKKLYTTSLFDIIQNIIDAIPNVYMIKVRNIDSSVVPMVFSKEYPGRSIAVVTWDNVDILLSFYCDNCTVVYDGRKNGGISPVVTEGRGYIDTITNAINPNHYGMFATKVVLASVGSYMRSLYGIGRRPSGYDVVGQWLQNVFENNSIPIDYNDFTVISRQLKSSIKVDFEETYRGTDLEMQYQLLTDTEKTDILYKLDHTPVDPKEIIKLFPNIVFDWNKLFQ